MFALNALRRRSSDEIAIPSSKLKSYHSLTALVSQLSAIVQKSAADTTLSTYIHATYGIQNQAEVVYHLCLALNCISRLEPNSLSPAQLKRLLPSNDTAEAIIVRYQQLLALTAEDLDALLRLRTRQSTTQMTFTSTWYNRGVFAEHTAFAAQLATQLSNTTPPVDAKTYLGLPFIRIDLTPAVGPDNAGRGHAADAPTRPTSRSWPGPGRTSGG